METGKETEQQSSKMSRRKFMGTAAAVTAFTIVPRRVLGGAGVQAPSDTLNIATVGIITSPVKAEPIAHPAKGPTHENDTTAVTSARKNGAKKPPLSTC